MADALDLEKLRALHERVAKLLESRAVDLGPFIHARDKHTFRRKPSSQSKSNDVGVTVTCSCLMALALCKDLRVLRSSKAIAKAFDLTVNAKWESSGLVEDNAFTTCLILRTLGLLTESGILNANAKKKKHNQKTLQAIASDLAGRAPESLSVAQHPPSPVIGYWFIDGIDRSSISLTKRQWERLIQWASGQSGRQLSFIHAKHDALMDPVALCMCTCLCSRLRKICIDNKLSTDRSLLAELPSQPELESALALAFEFQGESGIWPKYFPIFNYKKEDAGSNYCFTFEMLEAVMTEFSPRGRPSILFNDRIIARLGKAVEWCERNRFIYYHKKTNYTGWNSGGLIEDMVKGVPESWATAVVHMFLWELNDSLVNSIQDHLLRIYRAKQPKAGTDGWDEMLDLDVSLRNRDEKKLKEIFDVHLITPIHKKAASNIREAPLTGRRSALLFGPPGTSKTRFARGLAQKLQWPLIEINPSNLLSGGLERIYQESDRIFRDLSDIAGAVVFFDEMDALVRSREEKDSRVTLDTISRFLTTSMLPKLAELHDQGKVVFLMATNYAREFDKAIIRPGRFDILVCMGPPSKDTKLENLHKLMPATVSGKESAAARHKIRKYLNEDHEASETFHYLTVGEAKVVFESISKHGIEQYLSAPDSFLKLMEEWKGFATLAKDSALRKQYDAERSDSCLQ